MSVHSTKMNYFSDGEFRYYRNEITFYAMKFYLIFNTYMYMKKTRCY